MARGAKEIFAEANRRRVFRTAGVYLVAVWGVSQGAAELAPLFGAPEWLVRAFVIGAIASLPAVVVLSWMFDIGRDGIVRDPEDISGARIDDPDIADVPTIGRGDLGAGAVIVRWDDAEGEQSMIFNEEFFLGRGNDCRVRFYDPLVSRRHARLFFEGGGWHLEDLGSRNGTFVNENPANDAMLVGESLVRLNEAGPILRIEIVEPGAAGISRVAGLSIEGGVAHLRAIR